jgi:MFS family permease
MPTAHDRHSKTTSQKRIVLKVLLGGVFGLVVAMGIGRFVYTPILPLMQRDLGVSHSLAGWLAGLNYFGYLAGAIVCTVKPQILRYRLVTGGALLASLATTFFMGATVAVFWWGVMRLVGGLASAILFIVISAEVAKTLTRRGYAHWIGALYGGVGLGIALSGLLVPVFDKFSGWDGSWYGMGMFATFLAVLGLYLGRNREIVEPHHVKRVAVAENLKCVRVLALSYFFQGFGYIITATFIVAIIAVTPGLEVFAPYSWVAVGFAAAPSTVLWPYLARRIGSRKALLTACSIQAAGILVSVGADTIPEVLFAAITFGGTFMGIVTMTLAEGNQRMPADGGLAAAFLTAGFSIGQMLGPIVAGVLADIQAGFTLPLLLAAASVVAGGVIIILDPNFVSFKTSEEL